MLIDVQAYLPLFMTWPVAAPLSMSVRHLLIILLSCVICCPRDFSYSRYILHLFSDGKISCQSILNNLMSFLLNLRPDFIFDRICVNFLEEGIMYFYHLQIDKFRIPQVHLLLLNHPYKLRVQWYLASFTPYS